MVRRQQRPKSLIGKVFTAEMAYAAGLSPRQLRSQNWRRLLHGIYADADLVIEHRSDDHGIRIAGAALLMPASAVISGFSAAWLYGTKLLPPRSPVEITVPKGVRFGPIKGLRIHQMPLSAADLSRVTSEILPFVSLRPQLTTPLRTAWDIARQAPIVEAITALDALASANIVRLSALDRMASVPNLWRRHRVQQVLSLVDPRAESPQESRLRAQLVLAGLPRPEPQFVIRHQGRFIARVDLAWPAVKLAVEYDGHWHASPHQLRKDRRRLNYLTAAKWRVLHVTDEQLRDDLDSLVAKIRSLLES